MPEFVILCQGSPQLNSQRVLRGGSWINNARNLRSANRNANSPDNRNHNIGLRLAGALLKRIHSRVECAGGSINQWWFLSVDCLSDDQQQNQDPQRVSRHTNLDNSLRCNEEILSILFLPGGWGRRAESLLPGCSFFAGRCCHAY